MPTRGRGAYRALSTPPSLNGSRSTGALVLAALLTLSALPSSGAVAVRPSGETSGFQENYDLEKVTLPQIAYLSSYLYNNHGRQYPIWDYTGKYADELVYVDNSSEFHYYDPYTGSNGTISGAVTPLYQTTTGLEDQIDNEFALDTPGDVALAYGNLTTSPGDLTVEAVFLSNGTVRQVTTPVQMGNAVQSDYIGGGLVVTFNATPSAGKEAYFTDLWNGTSWPTGQEVGFAPANIYWVWELGAFINVQGNEVEQYDVRDESLVRVANVWFNASAVVGQVSGVQGVEYTTRGIAVNLDLDNALSYVGIVPLQGGEISAAGSYGFLASYFLYLERYSFTTPYVWATAGTLTGRTELVDPFDNATETTPGLVSRTESSGGWSNYELSDPDSTAVYVSLNGSLVNTTLGPTQYVFAYQPSTPTTGAAGGATGPNLGDLEIAVFLGVAALGIAIVVGFDTRRRVD